MKKRFKKLQEDSFGLIGAGIGTSVGSSILGSVGGTAATHGQQGLANISRFYPAVGTMIGGGFTLGLLSDLGKESEKSLKKKKNNWF